MSPIPRPPEPPSGAATITTRRELLAALRIAQGQLLAVDDRAFMAAQDARRRRASRDYLKHALTKGLLAGEAKDDAEKMLLVEAMREARDD
ncbi:MAG: hypothetical protein H0V97_08005 [Actinobacteria bacterium]|nr:hypothetical protein [Actinomycetota bacterium]